jgi:hypothetical protein
VKSSSGSKVVIIFKDLLQEGSSTYEGFIVVFIVGIMETFGLNESR